MEATELFCTTKGVDATVSFMTDRGERVSADAVAFGAGASVLLMIPGLSDGLATVRGKLPFLRRAYRSFAGDYRVVVASRINELRDGATISSMADDYLSLARSAGRAGVDVWGVSMGGMIAQAMALADQSAIRRLCLDVSAASATPYLRGVLDDWLSYAARGDSAGLLRDTMERTYRDRDLRAYRLLMPLLVMLTRVRSFDRFVIQARACRAHDLAGRLGSVGAPCLVSGGDSDKILGPGAVEALHEAIPGSSLRIYPGYGHNAYEAKGHTAFVRDFLLGR